MELVGRFRVAKIVRAPLNLLWQSVNEVAGVTRRQFDAYFAGLEFGVGIRIADVVEFREPIPLDELRTVWRGFQPPQGFRYVESRDLGKLPIARRRAA